MKVKYLIVGQGIAGTLLAMECIKRDFSFKIIDSPKKSLASKVAAGIINPITGRKFVKTWMYEELEQVFLESYRWAEELLGGIYLTKKEIIRAIPNIKDQNNWDARMLQEEAASYMNNLSSALDFEDKIRDRAGFGNVSGYQLKIGDLVRDFRNFLVEKGQIVSENLDHSNLYIETDAVRYGEVEAEAVVFCEGHLVSDNPFFKDQPFTPAKGELLLVRIPGLKASRILKDHLFLVPIEDEVFWVGASYAWEDFTDTPSLTKKEWLIESLDKILEVPYEIIDHQAGVRPATKFRRPLMGTHPENGNVHLFNGLGTKGSSLGPFWAKHFMSFLSGEEELSDEVKIR